MKTVDVSAFMARHGVVETVDPDLKHCQDHGPYRAQERLPNGQIRVLHRHCPQCAAETQNRERLQGVPRRYREAEIASSKASRAQQWSAEALALCDGDVQPNLWLHGPVGTGKTHLGHALCAHQTLQGKRAQLRSLRALLADIRSSWKPGAGERQEDILLRLANIPVLVIDEVDKVRWSDNTRELFFALIDLRYQEDHQTILVSNARPERVRAWMGEASWDRLQEFLVILTPGQKSLRRAQEESDVCANELPVALYAENRQTEVLYHAPSTTAEHAATVSSARYSESSGTLDHELADAVRSPTTVAQRAGVGESRPSAGREESGTHLAQDSIHVEMGNTGATPAGAVPAFRGSDRAGKAGGVFESALRLPVAAAINALAGRSGAG